MSPFFGDLYAAILMPNPQTRNSGQSGKQCRQKVGGHDGSTAQKKGRRRSPVFSLMVTLSYLAVLEFPDSAEGFSDF
jgi:hypothetical protein